MIPTATAPWFRRHGPLLLCAIVFVLYTLVGSKIVDRWQHRTGQPLASAGFGYGVLIDALDRTGEYRVCEVHYPGICFSAHRLPLVPGFLMALRKLVGDDLAAIGLAKALIGNLALGAALWLAWRNVRRERRRWCWLLLMPFAIPFWNLTHFELSVEEGYLIATLALLFALLWFSPKLALGDKRVALAIGVLGAVLVGLKHSMPYWALTVPVLAAVRAGSWRIAPIAGAPVLAALLALALFNAHVADRFTIASSWEGWNLYKGNNAETRRVYPWKSLDTLDYAGLVHADRPLRDEWDHNAYFRAKAWDFVREHPGEFLANAAAKAWVFLIEVRRTGRADGTGNAQHPVRWLQIAAMVGFRACLLAALFFAAHLASRRKLPWRERIIPMSFLLFIGLYGAFHLVGFAYERHVMPLVVPTVLFLVWHGSRDHFQPHALTQPA